jgi:hypothetical protein
MPNKTPDECLEFMRLVAVTMGPPAQFYPAKNKEPNPHICTALSRYFGREIKKGNVALDAIMEKISEDKTIKDLKLMYYKNVKQFQIILDALDDIKKIDKSEVREAETERLLSLGSALNALHKKVRITRDAVKSRLNNTTLTHSPTVFLLTALDVRGGGGAHDLCVKISPGESGILYDPNVGCVFMPNCDTLMILNVLAFVNYCYTPSGFYLEII